MGKDAHTGEGVEGSHIKASRALVESRVKEMLRRRGYSHSALEQASKPGVLDRKEEKTDVKFVACILTILLEVAHKAAVCAGPELQSLEQLRTGEPKLIKSTLKAMAASAKAQTAPRIDEQARWNGVNWPAGVAEVAAAGQRKCRGGAKCALVPFPCGK